MSVHSNEIELIVKKVLENVVAANDSHDNKKVKTYMPNSTGTKPLIENEKKDIGNYGVFDTMEGAIEAAYNAQREYIKKFQLRDREKLINNIRKFVINNAEKLAKMVRDETNIGNYEDKIQKHLLVAKKTPGIECIETSAVSGDDGLTLVEHAPYGVIGAITPVTNPTETIINNVISMIAGGNSVVFNVHPSAKKCCAFCIQEINKVIESSGGPVNLATMVKDPSLDTVKILSDSPKVRILVGTGGMNMVSSLLKTGKKVIGAGAGNPPVIVDETADIKHSAKEIFKGASFDNNLLCLAEKSVFVQNTVATDLIYYLIDEGAFLLNNKQLEQIMDLVLIQENTLEGKKYRINKEWVGQDAGKMLETIGMPDKRHVKLIICEVEHNHPLVLLEQLMPVLPIVKFNDLDEGIEYAMIAEAGNRHTASMFSTNVCNLTKFAREVETTIFVKNACTLAGVGFDGEGSTTMTIAGPTGEGITNALSFTRQRRCVLAEGSFRII